MEALKQKFFTPGLFRKKEKQLRKVEMPRMVNDN